MQIDVFNVIKENLANPKARFIFHSEAAALSWCEYVLSVFNIVTIQRERFLAWDMFKSKITASCTNGKKTVSDTIRLIYAHKLCKENYDKKFIKNIIPEEFSKDSMLFVDNIKKILPTLKTLKKKKSAMINSEIKSDNINFDDFDIIEYNYNEFLDKNNLFEPYWSNDKISDTEYENYIIFPELIEDFNEFTLILSGCNIHIINLEEIKNENIKDLMLYDSERVEIHDTVIELHRLHRQENIPYDDMILSVGNLKSVETYIRFEMDNYNVPYRIRYGKPIADYSAGMFWGLARECAKSCFTWDSIAALLTNNYLPWRCHNKNAALLSFGIKNSCLSSYDACGIKHDSWEDAFLILKNKQRLANHYKKLKNKILNLYNSKTAKQLLSRSIGFFKCFFTDVWNDDVSSVLGRALSELYNFVAIEEEYPCLILNNPLDIFINILKETKHVQKNEQAGIMIYEYGISASIPAPVHFIIGATQKNITKLSNPFSYLRNDKRKFLNIEDTDMTNCFLTAYMQMNNLPEICVQIRISASRKTFSGAQIPPSSLKVHNNNILQFSKTDYDAYRIEKEWWNNFTVFPDYLLPMQRKGFDSHRYFLYNITRCAFNNPIPKTTHAGECIINKISYIKRKDRNASEPDGKLRIAPTSLTLFFDCPKKWLYKIIFDLNEYPINAVKFDNRKRGILYHELLYKLFLSIKEKNNIFIRENYKILTKKAVEEAIKKVSLHTGPLERELIVYAGEAALNNTERLLRFESEKFTGYGIMDLEVSYAEERETIILTGTLDRVSLTPDFYPVIIDYKTGRIPAKQNCIQTDDKIISDFQMAMYIKVFEYNHHGNKVQNALFINPVQIKIQNIICNNSRSERDSFEKTLNVLEEFIIQHEKAVADLDFSQREIKIAGGCMDFSNKKILRKRCVLCTYRYICRTI